MEEIQAWLQTATEAQTELLMIAIAIITGERNAPYTRQEMAVKAILLRCQGRKVYQIADELNCSDRTVYRLIRYFREQAHKA